MFQTMFQTMATLTMQNRQELHGAMLQGFCTHKAGLGASWGLEMIRKPDLGRQTITKYG